MYDQTAPAAAWPEKRGDKEAFASQYGAERAERYQRAFHETDAIADAVFASGRAPREIMPNLRAALAAGEAQADTLPEVAALIQDMRDAVGRADLERIERGRRVYFTIPIIQHGLSLGPGSLVHTYSTPAIADVLANTGELTDGAVTRLAYTTNWIYSLFVRDGLLPGGRGFQHTGMVRAMHAHVRRVHADRGLDYSGWGSAISEFDMLRTWLDFTYIPYKGLRQMGWSPSQSDMQDVFYLWKVVGWMLGISPDLLEGLDDIEASQETIDAIHAVDGDPNEASQALVDALMSGFVVNAKGLLGMADETLADWTHAHVRMIHGAEIADSYKVPESVMQPILEMNVPGIAAGYELMLADPEAREAEIQRNEALLLQLLTDDTAYNKQDSGLAVPVAR